MCVAHWHWALKTAELFCNDLFEYLKTIQDYRHIGGFFDALGGFQ